MICILKLMDLMSTSFFFDNVSVFLNAGDPEKKILILHVIELQKRKSALSSMCT